MHVYSDEKLAQFIQKLRHAHIRELVGLRDETINVLLVCQDELIRRVEPVRPKKQKGQDD